MVDKSGPRGGEGAGTAVAAVALLCVLGLLVAPAVGDLIQPAPLDVWPELDSVVRPEPTEQARFLFAVLGPIVIAALLLFGSPRQGRIARAVPLPLAGAIAGLAGLALVAVGWVTRSEPLTYGLAADYFSNVALVVACCIAGALALLALTQRGRTHVARLLREPASGRGSRLVGSAAMVALVIGLTVLYAGPSAYTSAGVRDAVPLTWGHVPFTFADFAAFGNGATPLTDFASQYSNLLPWMLHPALSAFDYSSGSFTVLMSLLTVVCMLALWRTLSLTVANVWVGAALYLPVLALGLRPTIVMGDERASNASLYQIMPERYLLPLILAWLCARHLRGRRPHSPVGLFVVAGLAVLNNPEFGTPGLFAAFVALVIGSSESPRRAVIRVGVQLVAGVVAATVLVSVLTIARSGSPPDPGLLTYFSRLFGAQGFGLEPMPTLGLHLALYVSFAGALILAAARRSSERADRALCGMLGFAGAFGLGASGYYVGRSNAITLVALFPAWGLCLALLAWTSFSWLLELTDRKRIIRPVGLLAVCSLIGFGLAVTDLSGVPNPRTQVQRLSDQTTATTLRDRDGAASQFLAARTKPGEPVLVLRQNGHLLARAAGVRNVGTIGHLFHVISATQVAAELETLRNAGGTKVFTHAPYGPFSVTPYLAEALRSTGWTQVATEREGNITEWNRPPADRRSLPAGPAAASSGCRHPDARAATENGLIDAGGQLRAYNLRVPDATEAVPLVVTIHGALANPDFYDSISGWPAIAAREEVALLTPGVTARPSGVWTLNPAGSDVAYLRRLIDEVESKVCVDLNRVYLTGFSQGGMLALILACTEPQRFAAVAPVAGMIDIECEGRSTPVIAFHGEADRTVGFDGHLPPEVAAFVGYEDGPSVPELADEWHAELVTHPGGHIWPPDTADETWAFFEKHPSKP